MREFKYKPPRVQSGDLRTPVTFYRFEEMEGPMPGGSSSEEPVYRTWAKVDTVWLKDVEIAKANGTLSDVTIVMRDPLTEFIPDNHHLIGIEDPQYRHHRYRVKQIQPDLQNKQFINVIAEVKA